MRRIIEYNDAKRVVVSGDIHGDFKGIVYKLCIQYGLTDTLLIVAGDCGFGFEKQGYYESVYNHVAERLRKANNWVVFLRGNHDDPSYFSQERIAYERWRCISDYTILQACSHNIICIGGATSVDRSERKEENARLREKGHLETAVWWPDEAPFCSLKVIDSIPSDIRIDTVVTHTAPAFCEPQNKQGLKPWVVMDPAIVWDTDWERRTMDAIFLFLRGHRHPIKRWYYGHFHQSWSGQREGVLFSMLDIEEMKEIPVSGAETPAFNPDETIQLRGHSGEGVFLQRIDGNEYELCGDLKYMRIIGDAEVEDAINAVDPPGGPFLQVGSKVADKTIKEIRWNRNDDRFFLVLE